MNFKQISGVLAALGGGVSLAACAVTSSDATEVPGSATTEPESAVESAKPAGEGSCGQGNCGANKSAAEGTVDQSADGLAEASNELAPETPDDVAIGAPAESPDDVAIGAPAPTESSEDTAQSPQAKDKSETKPAKVKKTAPKSSKRKKAKKKKGEAACGEGTCA